MASNFRSDRRFETGSNDSIILYVATRGQGTCEIISSGHMEVANLLM